MRLSAKAEGHTMSLSRIPSGGQNNVFSLLHFCPLSTSRFASSRSEDRQNLPLDNPGPSDTMQIVSLARPVKPTPHNGQTKDQLVKRSSRDAWFCAIGLLFLTMLLDAFVRVSRERLPGFADFSKTLAGRFAYMAALDGLLLAGVVRFSHATSARDFLARMGLRQRPTVAGWYAAWAALGLAALDHYGAAKGWTASAWVAREHAGYVPESIWFLIVTSAVIGPFVEEIMTRGYLYRAFRASYGTMPSTGLIICFSAYFHAGSMSHSVFTAVLLVSLWLILCLLRERSGSLWNCAFCHGIYNAAIIRQWPLCVAAMILFLLLPKTRLASFRKAAAEQAGSRES